MGTHKPQEGEGVWQAPGMASMTSFCETVSCPRRDAGKYGHLCNKEGIFSLKMGYQGEHVPTPLWLDKPEAVVLFLGD